MKTVRAQVAGGARSAALCHRRHEGAPGETSVVRYVYLALKLRNVMTWQPLREAQPRLALTLLYLIKHCFQRRECINTIFVCQ